MPAYFLTVAISIYFNAVSKLTTSIRSYLVAILFALASPWCYGQTSDLANYALPNANSVLFLNVSKLMASELANSENWREEFEKAYATGVISLPPTTNDAMICSEIDFSSWTPTTTVAAFNFQDAISLNAISRQYQGLNDEILGKKAVLLPQDIYVVQAEDRRAAMINSANRQAVTRWVKAALSNPVNQLSTYLKAAADRRSISDLVQAFDLEGAIPNIVLAGKVKSSAALAKLDEQESQQALKLLQSLRGITLEVIVRTTADSRLVVDFGDSILDSAIEEHGKELLLEVLAEAGLMIDDLSSWNGRAEETKYILQGKLSGNGLKHVMRLIRSPISNFFADDKKLIESNNESQMAYESQQYFRSIQKVMAEIDEMTKRDDVAISRYAKWFSHWADEIDALPILNVDPDLLDYTQKLSASFRACSDAIAGIKIQAGSRGAQVWNGLGEYYVWSNDQANARNAIRKEEQARGVASARDIYRGIQSSNQEIRRSLTAKYNLEF